MLAFACSDSRQGLSGLLPKRTARNKPPVAPNFGGTVIKQVLYSSRGVLCVHSSVVLGHIIDEILRSKLPSQLVHTSFLHHHHSRLTINKMEKPNSTNGAAALTTRQSHSKNGSSTPISPNPGNIDEVVDTAETSIPLTPSDPRSAAERPLLHHIPAETTLPAARKGIGSFNSWWWWEIASASLSVICMILLLVLLLQVDSLPLESWTLPIQVNSLVAVFTTVAKTSMMVPVAACLSQLKWRHYLHRSDRLHNLQLFDDASRGPWGSTMLLLNLRRRAILSWAFAFITIVALGIDPSAQQILDFPSREVELRNVTAILGRAENYSSKAYVQGKFSKSSLLTMPSFLPFMDRYSVVLTDTDNGQ